MPKPQSKAASTAHARINWEDAVYAAICESLDVSRSDAQAIAEAQCTTLESAWSEGATPAAAAIAVARASDGNYMPTLHVDMLQFRAKWRDYSDNIRLGEVIRATRGVFLTLDAAPYIAALNDFAIAYTLTKK
jgi:hypothetical protein